MPENIAPPSSTYKRPSDAAEQDNSNEKPVFVVLMGTRVSRETPPAGSSIRRRVDWKDRLCRQYCAVNLAGPFYIFSLFTESQSPENYGEKLPLHLFQVQDGSQVINVRDSLLGFHNMRRDNRRHLTSEIPRGNGFGAYNYIDGYSACEAAWKGIVAVNKYYSMGAATWGNGTHLGNR
ncbi:hypothetical protein B0H11DRAFT_1912848 [Mycena galericulata]|nr:hypothetical protein B0H11DRAFT_1912848 [Mycena galericulata]